MRSLNSSRSRSYTRLVRRVIGVTPSGKAGTAGLVHPFFVNEFDDVAVQELVEAAQHDAALVPGLDLADVVLEALQPFALRFRDLLAVAQDSDVGSAPERPIQDETPGDLAEA